MRRQRFRAHLERAGALSERTILAYEVASVADFYRRMGYTVLHVESARKKRTCERPANKPWRHNDRAIRDAIEFLGITLPVRIKPTNVAGGRLGAHTLRPVGPGVRRQGSRVHGIEHATGLVHHITVKSWQDAEQASRTLWHELTHAMQAERELAKLPDPNDLRTALRTWGRAYRDGRSYDRKPIEREAREYEEFAAEHPLVRELGT